MHFDHYYRSLRPIVVLTLGLGLWITEGKSQAVTYSGVVDVSPSGSAAVDYPNFPVFMATNGTFTDWQSVTDIATQVGFQITVDPTAQTLSFDEVRVQTAAFTISRTSTITVGFGQTKTFTETLNVNPMVWSASDSHIETLVPGVNGAYTIQGVDTSFSYLSSDPASYVTGSATATGTYTITGPTQTVTGSFSQTLNATGEMILGSATEFHGPVTLGTSNYPATLELGGSASSYFIFSFVNTDLPISDVVDGTSIQTGLGGSGFGENNNTIFFDTVYTNTNSVPLSLTAGTLPTAVPEPAAIAAWLGALAFAGGCFSHYRRHRVSASSKVA